MMVPIIAVASTPSNVPLSGQPEFTKASSILCFNVSGSRLWKNDAHELGLSLPSVPSFGSEGLSLKIFSSSAAIFGSARRCLRFGTGFFPLFVLSRCLFRVSHLFLIFGPTESRTALPTHPYFGRI